MQYNDEEYSALLSNDPGWTKEETDHLFDLCKRFAMRFTGGDRARLEHTEEKCRAGPRKATRYRDAVTVRRESSKSKLFLLSQ